MKFSDRSALGTEQVLSNGSYHYHDHYYNQYY